MSRRTWCGLELSTVIAAGAMLVAPAALAKPKPKPDLQVVRARIVGKNYALNGERATIRVTDVTRTRAVRKHATRPSTDSRSITRGRNWTTT